MSKASKSEQEYRQFLHDEGKMEHTGNRKRIWDGAQRALLEWARSKSEHYLSSPNDLYPTDCVRISDLEAYFAEESK